MSFYRLDGLDSVPYLTYQHIFENKRLPRSMIVIGGGPVGAEIAQAYQRLGCQVTIVAERLLPKEDPDVRELLQQLFEREGVLELSLRHGARRRVRVGARAAGPTGQQRGKQQQ